MISLSKLEAATKPWTGERGEFGKKKRSKDIEAGRGEYRLWFRARKPWTGGIAR